MVPVLKQKCGTGIKTKNYGTSIKTKIRYRYYNMVSVLKQITVLRARIHILGSARHHKKIDNGSARPDPQSRIRAA
jgi:hypothetical protein